MRVGVQRRDPGPAPDTDPGEGTCQAAYTSLEVGIREALAAEDERLLLRHDPGGDREETHGVHGAARSSARASRRSRAEAPYSIGGTGSSAPTYVNVHSPGTGRTTVSTETSIARGRG